MEARVRRPVVTQFVHQTRREKVGTALAKVIRTARAMTPKDVRATRMARETIPKAKEVARMPILVAISASGERLTMKAGFGARWNMSAVGATSRCRMLTHTPTVATASRLSVLILKTVFT